MLTSIIIFILCRDVPWIKWNKRRQYECLDGRLLNSWDVINRFAILVQKRMAVSFWVIRKKKREKKRKRVNYTINSVGEMTIVYRASADCSRDPYTRLHVPIWYAFVVPSCTSFYPLFSGTTDICIRRKDNALPSLLLEELHYNSAREGQEQGVVLFHWYYKRYLEYWGGRSSWIGPGDIHGA